MRKKDQPLPSNHVLTDETDPFDKLEAVARRNVGRRVPITDAYGTPMTNLRPLKSPEGETIRRIRTVLALQGSDHYLFPRCRYKDFKVAHKLDDALGYTREDIDNPKKGYHTRYGHVCAECRCRHTAGSGTRGWWYWPEEDGPEHGHFGVGPCFRHSPWYYEKFRDDMRLAYKDMILREVRTMREFGRVQDREGNYMVDVRHMGEMARARTDTKTSLHALKRLADETIEKLRAQVGSGDDGSAMIEGLCDVFGFPPDMLDPRDRDRIMCLTSQRPLTETAHGRHIPMSDKTAIMLQKDLLKAVGDSAFQSFKSHEEDFMSKALVAKMIERFYAEAETLFRPLGGEGTWGRFREALRDVAREITDGGDLGDRHEPRTELDVVVETRDRKPQSKPPHERTEEDDAGLFEEG